jgi:hypothetical protein
MERRVIAAARPIFYVVIIVGPSRVLRESLLRIPFDAKRLLGINV